MRHLWRTRSERSEPVIGKEFLSLEEAGALLGVKRGRAWELARSGSLPAVRLGRRWYVPRKALDRLAEEAYRRASQRLGG